jgi:GntR family transcriptional regulator, N-acetylglucosamine utilization regulator
MASIDRDSPIPYYFQLKQILLAKIQTNEWKARDLIPGEHELERLYEVSRTTIRLALRELVSEGYLVRQRGRGTFIAQPKIVIDSTRRFDLKEYDPQTYGPMEWRFIDKQNVIAPQQVCDALKLNDGDSVERVRRLRLAGQDVLGYYITYVPLSVAIYIDDENLAIGEPLGYLHKYPSIERVGMERIMAATLADIQDVEFLNIKRNAPILHLERIVVAEDGVPIEFMVGRFRGDRFKFRLTDS